MFTRALGEPKCVCVCVCVCVTSYLFGGSPSDEGETDVYFTLQCIQGATLCSVFSYPILLNQHSVVWHTK